jgi:ABC-type antimicrobial peptide transport system permease subunit
MCSREVYIVVTQPVPVPAGAQRRSRFIQLRGIEDPAVTAAVHGLNLYPGGEWFSEAGVKEHAIEAVLGEGVAQELGHDLNKPMLEVGDIFDLGPRKWVVKGIMQSSGSTFGSEVWAKREVVGPMFGKDNYTSVVLRTRDGDSAQQLAKYLSTDFKKTALKAQTETEYYSKLAATNKQFLIAIIFVAIVMAIGGMFGVMNTMFAAIAQRVHDIGIMRLLGYASWQILVSFLLESLFIALLGGILGCAVGYLSDGLTASSIVSSGQGGGKSVVLKLVVDSNTLAVGILFTLVMGGLGGLFPALWAMRLKPLESLR